MKPDQLTPVPLEREAPPAPGEAEARSLARALLPALNHVQRLINEGKRPRIADLLDPLGSRAVALAAIMVSLPLLSPLTLGPLTPALAFVVFHASIQLMRGRENLVLPDKLRQRELPRALVRVLRKSMIPLVAIRHWDRTIRNVRIFPKRMAHVVAGTGMFIGGLLLLVPLPFIPFSNTFPALGIVCCGVAYLKRNDLFYIWTLVSYFITLCILAAVIAVAVWGGSGLMEVIEEYERAESEEVFVEEVPEESIDPAEGDELELPENDSTPEGTTLP